MFIVYKSDVWPRDLNKKFTLTICLFETVKLTKNVDLDSDGYSKYDIGFDTRSFFSINGAWGNVIIFGVENSLSVHTGNRQK